MPRRPLVARCSWCDEPMPAERSTRIYCTDACKQAAYRQRKRADRDQGQLTRAQEVERRLRADVRLLEQQLERAERRADDHIAAVRAVMDERDALERSVGRLTEQLIAADTVYEDLRTRVEAGPDAAYRQGYLDASEEVAVRKEVEEARKWARFSGYHEGYAAGRAGSPPAKDMRRP